MRYSDVQVKKDIKIGDEKLEAGRYQSYDFRLEKGNIFPTVIIDGKEVCIDKEEDLPPYSGKISGVFDLYAGGKRPKSAVVVVSNGRIEKIFEYANIEDLPSSLRRFYTGHINSSPVPHDAIPRTLRRSRRKRKKHFFLSPKRTKKSGCLKYTKRKRSGKRKNKGRDVCVVKEPFSPLLVLDEYGAYVNDVWSAAGATSARIPSDISEKWKRFCEGMVAEFEGAQ